MKRFLGFASGLVLGVSALVGVIVFTGGSSAQTPSPTMPAGSGGAQQHRALPTLVAVAIGELKDKGDTVTVDLRAGIRDGKTGGSFRFYSKDDGYYNGAVRVLEVNDGVIHASGGGGLWKDGARRQVRFDLTISQKDGQTQITVRERNGESYSISGHLDGLIRAGDPASVIGKTQAQ